MKIDYEMIMCVVNAGYANDVMDVAKKNGATGGTVVHARGTGSREIEEMLNLTYNPEKDLILIVVEKELVENMLSSIYNSFGLDSEAKGIAFSLPVFSQIGMMINNNDK